MSLALVIGLGARLLLHKLNGSPPAVDNHSFLIERLAAGLWQGASVHLALTYSPRLALGITIGIAVRVAVTLLQVYIGRSDNPVALAASLLGLAFGVLAADVADALVARLSTWGAPPKKRRTLSRRRSVGVPPREQVQPPSSTPTRHAAPVNGHAANSQPRMSSPEPGSGTTTPATNGLQASNIAVLENELAELQAKAAEAAAQKARFSEERAWALDARNFSWASQLAWQIQRCDVLERSYASAARQKMRELENQNFAVHVDIFGRSYLDDVLVHIEDRLVEARALGKSRLRVALSGPREQVDNEIKPLVRNHFKGMKRHVLQDPVDPTILYIDVDPWPVEDESVTTGVKSDDWSRALD